MPCVDAELAEALTRSLCDGPWPREGHVSLYLSYSDESESGDGKGPFVVCGYLAKDIEWPNLSKRWVSEVLEPYPSIPYVHMVELRSEKWRKKCGICRKQADQKVRDAIEVIAASDYLRPFVGKISQSEYLEVRERLKAKGYEYSTHGEYVDYLCYLTYAVVVIGNVADNGDVERITFNISRKQYVSHYIAENFRNLMVRYLRERGHVRWADMVGDFVPLSMEEHTPLQAADVLSWHLRRYFCEKLDTTDLENAERLDNGRIIVLEMEKRFLDDFGSDLPNAIDSDDAANQESEPSK